MTDAARPAGRDPGPPRPGIDEALVRRQALTEAARYIESEMAQAWGGGARWLTTGRNVADLVAEVLRDLAAQQTSADEPPHPPPSDDAARWVPDSAEPCTCGPGEACPRDDCAGTPAAVADARPAPAAQPAVDRVGLARLLAPYPGVDHFELADALLAAVVPRVEAAVAADERRKVADEIAAAIEGQAEAARRQSRLHGTYTKLQVHRFALMADVLDDAARLARAAAAAPTADTARDEGDGDG